MFALHFAEPMGGSEWLVYHIGVFPLDNSKFTISRTCCMEMGLYSVGSCECWAAFILSYCFYCSRLTSMLTGFFSGLYSGSLGAYLFCSMILLLVNVDETGCANW